MTENYTQKLRQNHVLFKGDLNFTIFDVGKVLDDIVEVNLSKDVIFNARFTDVAVCIFLTQVRSKKTKV